MNTSKTPSLPHDPNALLITKHNGIMKTFRVIIAGSRYYCNYRKMVAKCDAILANKLSDPDCRVVIVSGCAQGADALGERYAWRHRLKVERYPADWEGLGKFAGPVRNELMAQNADALIAFPLYGVANRGTLDMIRRAREHNLLVRVIH